ncbi:MAG: 3-keto-disaccharide hydrolase [Planctomycetaceae bacterium]
MLLQPWNLLKSISLLVVGLLIVSSACNAIAAEDEGFTSIFDGKTLEGWMGSVDGYAVENGAIVCKPNGRNLYTKKEYSNFVLRFEFKLTPGANNGIGLRAPTEGDPAYVGMESQVLDDTADQYKGLKEYQFHGSIYGIAPAKRGHLKPVGEWNVEEIVCDGKHVKVTLNGVVIVDADVIKPIDGQNHPGLSRDKGHIAFCGHGAHVEFRNLRVKELK